MSNNERERMVKEANNQPLVELARQVVYGSYTPGVHDVVLMERLVGVLNEDVSDGT